MRIEGKVVVVTGGASGIGAAMARRFARERAAGVVVADVDAAGAVAVAESIVADGGRACPATVDVSVEADVRVLVAEAERTYGPIDLFCQNAGIARGGGFDAPDEAWGDSWSVNVMAHVHGARAVIPGMVERGGGYLLHTCSAAGLLTNPGAAPYAVTKHAAVAFAEWLSIHHRHQGIRVSALCPQGVRTPMVEAGGELPREMLASAGAILEPDEVAEAVVRGIDAETFLILPHPEVARYEQRRAADRDGWLAAMNRWVTSGP